MSVLLQYGLPAAIGLTTGILSGFGIGGGTLLVIYLTLATGMAQREAQGVNLIYFLCAALPAAVSHVKNGRVQVKLSLFAIAAGCITAAASALLTADMEMNLLRRLFGGLLLYAGARELYTAWKMTKEGDPQADSNEDNPDKPAK